VNRKSISTSFNSDEIESIDRVCAKLDITRGRLIKEAVTFWMLNHQKDAIFLKHPNLNQFYHDVVKPSKKPSGKLDFKKLSQLIRGGRYSTSFLQKTKEDLEWLQVNLKDEHEAYHALAKKKKTGAPKKSKKKPGRPKDKGR
jgi:hypothetical protein|tara:strand:+ start:96 stop:521 length:426 start_codon:yes stop_codon:yes gene_type:complete